MHNHLNVQRAHHNFYISHHQHQVGQIYTVINIIKIKELAILPDVG
jgi:hypothetical protein